VFRFIIWLTRRLRSAGPSAGQPSNAVPGGSGEFVTVRLPDGRLVEAQRAEQVSSGQLNTGQLNTGQLNTGQLNTGDGGAPGAPGQNPTILLVSPPGGPGPRRRWYSVIPRWVRWTALIVIIGVFFRRIVAWAVLAVLSGLLHLFGASFHLPSVSFGWPWSSSGTTTSNALVGPLVLQKVEGIDKPALGTTTFDFLFTHEVSKSMGILPCWYSATFYAVGKASATVDLNPGAAWWKASTGHYGLRVLSKPSGSTPGEVAITMSLPDPQLPQSVHDVSIDNTLSKPVSSDHSWTYPGLACGALIQPQFSQSVLYSQAQSEAFTQATTVKSVTQPLIAAAEKEANTIIEDNFVIPTLNAVNYKVEQFTIKWVPASASSG
jgi:hypothetical protein